MASSAVSPSKRQKVGTPDASGERPTICVLGATGVGKGSTLNSCFATDKFSTSNMFASDTTKPVSIVLPWRGTGDPVRGVDLCGFSDSEGRDTGFIEAMVAYLREEVRTVSCFLLLLNSQEPRVGMHLKDMLVALKSVFGLHFLQNVVVGCTRWDYTRKGAILRRGVTREALTTNVNGLLRTLLGHSHDLPCVFLDNTVHMCTAEENEVLHGEELPLVTRAFDEALEAVRRAAVETPSFHCADIESTLAERDVGRDLLEREAAANARGDEVVARLAEQWEAVGGEDPELLERRLADTSRAEREALQQYLAAKTRPDLEHVMTAVLELFDTEVPELLQSALARNRAAATSANRALRMRLCEEYIAFIAANSPPAARADDDATQASGSASGTPSSGPSPLQRFEAIRARYTAALIEYVDGCVGGPLAWQPLTKLQEALRMEQVGAREVLLRTELKAGRALPPLSEAASDAAALLEQLGRHPPPGWLQALAKGQ